MNHRYLLREFAKFAAGLVIGDLLAVIWLATNDILPVSFLGLELNNAVILPGILFDLSVFIILVHYGWHIGKAPVLKERTFLLLAGFFFGAVAAIHLIRIFTGVDVIVLGWTMPFWLSGLGTAVASYLCYMSFHLGLRMK